MRIALQPCAAPESKLHYRDTIESPVELASVASLLTPPLALRLGALYPDGQVPMWGLVPGRNNLGSHDALRAGDEVLFAADGHFFSRAVVTATWRNQPLAERLWGTEGDAPSGRTWELMYSLRDLRDLDIPYGDINAVIGYSPVYVPQGFRLLDEEKSRAVLAVLGAATPSGDVSEAEYREAIELPEGDLEREVLSKVRVEQAYLRQRLFGGRTEATCDLCARVLPVDLLVAAHIKKRAACTRDEKLDVDNIVMAACRLGCDELFERGYIAVNDSGTIIATSRSVARALEEVLGRVDGQRCSAHREGSRRYFADQREAVFRS